MRSSNDPQQIPGKVVDVVRRAIRLSALGARPVDRARLFLATFGLLVIAKTGRRGRRRLVVTLRVFGWSGRVTLADYSHLLLLEAIFLDLDYAVEPHEPPSVIVDLGSNIGLSIVYFRARFPAARIVGVEPDPAAFALLQRNTRDLTGVTLHRAAVGEHAGGATFWSAPGAVASSLHRTHDAQRPVEVQVRTLRDVLDDARIEQVDVLKLVVEGSEFAALRSLGDLDRIGAITGEVVLEPGTERSEAAFRSLLTQFDLIRFEDKGDGFWQFHAVRSPR